MPDSAGSVLGRAPRGAEAGRLRVCRGCNGPFRPSPAILLGPLRAYSVEKVGEALRKSNRADMLGIRFRKWPHARPAWLPSRFSAAHRAGSVVGPGGARGCGPLCCCYGDRDSHWRGTRPHRGRSRFPRHARRRPQCACWFCCDRARLRAASGQAATLLKLTERYCVVVQTLRTVPALAAGIRSGAKPSWRRPTRGSDEHCRSCRRPRPPAFAGLHCLAPDLPCIGGSYSNLISAATPAFEGPVSD